MSDETSERGPQLHRCFTITAGGGGVSHLIQHHTDESDGFCGISSLRSLLISCLLQVLVLGNKRDLPNALDEKQLIEKMYVLRVRGAVG